MKTLKTLVFLGFICMAALSQGQPTEWQTPEGSTWDLGPVTANVLEVSQTAADSSCTYLTGFTYLGLISSSDGSTGPQISTGFIYKKCNLALYGAVGYNARFTQEATASEYTFEIGAGVSILKDIFITANTVMVSNSETRTTELLYGTRATYRIPVTNRSVILLTGAVVYAPGATRSMAGLAYGYRF